MTSPEKNQQVLATAGALSAAFLVPQFTEVIAFILKMAWAFAESLSDCRRLLNGGKIPMMKDDGSWHLTWNQMLSLNEGMLDLNENSMGWDYDTYLQVFLLIEESDTICRRMTHVIEKNIRLMSGYEGFRMKNCVYGILVKYTCDFKSFGIHEVQTALSY